MRQHKEGLCSLVTDRSLPAFFESDNLIDDGNAVLVHYRRHGSIPEAQDICDGSVAGLTSWRAGRQAWAGAQHRKWSSTGSAYTEGGLYEHRVGVIPAEVLDVVDQLGWSPDLTGANRLPLGERYSEGQRLIPRVEQMLAAIADEQLGDLPFGYTVEPRLLYLTHRRPDGTAPNDHHVHQDGAFDVWRRWASAVFYFTPGDAYVGGDLLIVPTGERLRPGRGDVVLLRGDVEHQVEPLTAGARTTLTAHAAEARWWLDPRDDIERADPDERCRVLDHMFRQGQLDGPALRRGLALTWATCHYPEEELPADRWVAMFRAAGFLGDHVGNRQPSGKLWLFRACDPGRERRLTWSTSQYTARWFRENFDRAELWQALVPAEAVLALFGQFGAEVVVDPAGLGALVRIDG